MFIKPFYFLKENEGWDGAVSKKEKEAAKFFEEEKKEVRQVVIEVASPKRKRKGCDGSSKRGYRVGMGV